MESANQSGEPEAKVARQDTDYSLCIICQKTTGEDLVEKPTAYEKVLTFITERASHGDGIYPMISRRLGHVTCENLETKSATWHRKCYQETVHAGMCKRANV